MILFSLQSDKLFLAAGLICRSRFTGHGSKVMSHRSQIIGHRLQVTNIIIISCSALGKHKTYVYCSKTVSLIYIISVVINSFSVLIVLYYI